MVLFRFFHNFADWKYRNERRTKIFHRLERPLGGEHTFDFEAGNDLLRLFENTEIKGGHCDVKVNLLRAARQLRLEISIRGSVVVECDRCLGDCSVPIDYEGELLVKFSDEVREYDGDTLWLSPSEDFVDLTQYIYESIVLSLPYQRVHPDGECDPDMLGRFRIVSEQEFETIENETQQREREARPGQWTEQLSAIKQQMEQEEKTRNIKLIIDNTKWHILNTKSRQPAATSVELTTKQSFPRS